MILKYTSCVATRYSYFFAKLTNVTKEYYRIVYKTLIHKTAAVGRYYKSNKNNE